MRVVRLSETSDEAVIGQAVEVLERGGLVVYPTETCYGLGVDATSREGVARLLEFKARPEGKAVSIAVSDEEMAAEYVQINQQARNLYRQFLPGPMTVVSRVKKGSGVAEGVRSEKGTLGVRVPDHPLVLGIVRKLGRPLTATSANVSGRPSPYSRRAWLQQTSLKKQALVELFIDAGQLPRRQVSTVVDTTVGELMVLRAGAIKQLPAGQERVTRSEAETIELGRRLVKERLPLIAKKGLLVGLQGRLGAGKTRLAKGMGRALGVAEVVSSPSFELVHEHQGSWGKFYHVDLWRVETVAELSELGWEQMLGPGKLVAVEWAQIGWPEISKKARQTGMAVLVCRVTVINKHERVVTW